MEMTTLQEFQEAPSNEPPPPPVDPIRATSVSGDKSLPLAQRLDSLRREMLEPAVTPQAVVQEPVQPVQPQAPVTPEQTQPQAVPEKFKNPDGTVNVERIEQSTMSAEQALERYRAKEVELKRTINSVNNLTRLPPMPQPQEPQSQPQEQPGDLASLINADLAANPQNPGLVLAKWANAIKESVKSEASQDVRELQQEIEQGRRDRELETLAKHDPTVLTQQMIDTLASIRQQKPWLNASPRPWEAAYRDYLADQSLKGRVGSQVQMPSPTRVTAQVAPATTVNRAQVSAPVVPQSMSKDQIDAFLAGKSKADQGAFFKSMGLPWDARLGK